MSDTHNSTCSLVYGRLAQNNATTNGALAFGMFASVGRSLVAGRAIGCGEVVLQDTPVVTFPVEADGSVPDDNWVRTLATCCDAANQFLSGQPAPGHDQHTDATNTKVPVSEVPAYLQAAAHTLWPLVQAALVASITPEGGDRNPASPFDNDNGPHARGAALLDMHVPELPFKEVSRLYRFCESVVVDSSTDANEEDVTALLHAVMAAKVNSHRSADGTSWCLYPLASKLAHTCDPNLFYVPTMEKNETSDNDAATTSPYGAKFVATRDIAAGELLSFSYLGGDLLVGPAEPRQARLSASHRFVCACPRCSSMDTFTSEIFTVTSALGLAVLEPLGLRIRESRASVIGPGAYLVRRTSKRLESDNDISIKGITLQPQGNNIQSTKSSGAWCLVGLDFHTKTICITDELMGKALAETPLTSDGGNALIATNKTIGDLLNQAEMVVGYVRALADRAMNVGGNNIDDCRKVAELIATLESYKALLTDNIGNRHYLVSHILDCQSKLANLGGTLLQTAATASASPSQLKPLYDCLVSLLAADGDADANEDMPSGSEEVGVECKELLVRLHGRYTMYYLAWTSLTADMGGSVLGSGRTTRGGETQMFPTFVKYEQHVAGGYKNNATATPPAAASTESKCVSFPHPVVTQNLRTWCEHVILTAKPKLESMVFNKQKEREDGTPACILHLILNEENFFKSPFVRRERSLPHFEHDYSIAFKTMEVSKSSGHRRGGFGDDQDGFAFSEPDYSQELMGLTFPAQGPAGEVPTLFPSRKDQYNLVMVCLVGNLIVAPALCAGSNDACRFFENLALLTKCLLGGGAAPAQPTTLSPEVLQTLVPDYTMNFDYRSLSDVLDVSRARNVLFPYQPTGKVLMKVDIRIVQELVL